MVIPSRPLAQVVLGTRCPWWRVMNYGSCLLPLFCSVTTLGGKSMWFSPCGNACACMHAPVCVCVFAQGRRNIYMQMIWKGWDHLTLMLCLCWGLSKFPSASTAHVEWEFVLQCIWDEKKEKKKNTCTRDMIQSKTQSAGACKRGGYIYDLCLCKQI